ncbi:dipeptidase [Blastomonas aquatica]|uniref:Dipeptidase n=1 Tax=Blastomonas aquatica TaxID=1510276 RepID=A0ABQ1IVA7_9SPHN|nr:dipeptidase [Blastomonas aquatica]GGB52991.1 dipeptidase [Blastomonas aquatica]
MRFSSLGVLALALAASSAVAQTTPASTPAAQDAANQDPAAVHERILTLDTHLDSPANLDRPGWAMTDRHDVHDDTTQVDLPRMIEGGLDGGFWVIYTGQGPSDATGYARALAHALKRLHQIHDFVAATPESFSLATTAADAARIAASGKRVVYVSMENGYPLGTDLANLEAFYQLGLRMAGPVHNGTNQLADSTNGDPVHGGLSDLGKAWVKEANRLGIIIDASHASDTSFDQMLALSKAPIILSHSGPKALHDHPRNLDDDRLKALAAKGGVIQINSLFLSPNLPRPGVDALRPRMAEIDTLPPAERAALMKEWAKANLAEPGSASDFDRYMAAVFHCIDLLGVDHVGIGADWDGGGGVAGLTQITDIPKITQALLARGLTPAEVEKVWSGNVLRVMVEVEKVAGR